MQRYHRRRHLLIWLFLTPLIVLALVFGVLGRMNFPIEPKVPQSPTEFANP